MKVKLVKPHNPAKHIHAIKNLRVATGLGLKDAKFIADDVRGSLRPGVNTISPLPADYVGGIPTVIDVPESALGALTEVYETELVEDPPLGVDPALVTDFVLDVLAMTQPAVAKRLREQPTYIDLVAAVKAAS